MSGPTTYDDIVVGAGHNGLTAAAYLARAGRRVLVLERLDHVGGAAVSAAPFPGVEARLSRYSYLVSLLPRPIVEELELDVQLVKRRYASYTPLPDDPSRGLLIDTADPEKTRASFERAKARAYSRSSTTPTRASRSSASPAASGAWPFSASFRSSSRRVRRERSSRRSAASRAFSTSVSGVFPLH